MTMFNPKYNLEALHIYCAFGLKPDGERNNDAYNLCFEIVA